MNLTRKNKDEIGYVNMLFLMDMKFVSNLKVTYFDKDNNRLNRQIYFKRQRKKNFLKGWFPEYRLQVEDRWLLQNLDIVNKYEIEFILLKRIRFIVEIYKSSQYFIDVKPVFCSYFVNEILKNDNDTLEFINVKQIYDSIFNSNLEKYHNYNISKIIDDELVSILSKDFDFNHFGNFVMENEVDLLEHYILR